MENFDESLLTAYLDNELSAAERALVDQQLAANPHLNDLLDELRQVRSLVQLVASEKVPADLTSRVLARASEITAATAESRSTELPSPSQSSSAVTITRPWWSSSQLKWAVALATAACLLIMFVRPPGFMREIALRPKIETMKSAGETAPLAPEATSTNGQMPEMLGSNDKAQKHSDGALSESSQLSAKQDGAERDPDASVDLQIGAEGDSDIEGRAALGQEMNIPGGFGGGGALDAKDATTPQSGNKRYRWMDTNAESSELPNLQEGNASDPSPVEPSAQLAPEAASRAMLRNEPSEQSADKPAFAPSPLGRATGASRSALNPALANQAEPEIAGASQPDGTWQVELYRYKEDELPDRLLGFKAAPQQADKFFKNAQLGDEPSVADFDDDYVMSFQANIAIDAPLLESLGFVPINQWAEADFREQAKAEDSLAADSKLQVLSNVEDVPTRDREKVTLIIDSQRWDRVRQTFAARGIELREIAPSDSRQLSEVEVLQRRPPRLENPAPLGIPLIIEIKQPGP
jgi:hypothetical protein